MRKLDLVEMRLNGWEEYDNLGLDQKAELCLEVSSKLLENEAENRMKVLDIASDCLVS